MGNWIIRWNFHKPNYSPDEEALVSFWIENSNENPFYLSGLELHFDFGIYRLDPISGFVSSRENRFLGNIRLSLPGNVVGRKNFTVRYHMYEYVNDQ
jgi:hypothetical protein